MPLSSTDHFKLNLTKSRDFNTLEFKTKDLKLPLDLSVLTWDDLKSSSNLPPLTIQLWLNVFSWYCKPKVKFKQSQYNLFDRFGLQSFELQWHEYSTAYTNVFSVVLCAKRCKAIFLYAFSLTLPYKLLHINWTVNHMLEILRKLGPREPLNHEFFKWTLSSQYSIMRLKQTES